MSSSASNSSATSSESPSLAGGTGGALAHLRFTGKPGTFPIWKLKALAYFESTDLIEAVEVPLDPSDKVVSELLGRRGGSETYLAPESDNDDDAIDDSEPAADDAGTDKTIPLSPPVVTGDAKESATEAAGPKSVARASSSKKKKITRVSAAVKNSAISWPRRPPPV